MKEKKSTFDDYVPFGDEYKAHLMKLPKKHLIDLFINSARKNLITEDYIGTILNDLKESGDYADEYAFNLFTDLSDESKNQKQSGV